MQRRDELSLFDAADLLEMSPEDLCRLCEEGKVKCRRAGDERYFLRDEIQALRRKQVDEVRAQEAS
jgi:hypothetical protein